MVQSTQTQSKVVKYYIAELTVRSSQIVRLSLSLFSLMTHGEEYSTRSQGASTPIVK